MATKFTTAAEAADRFGVTARYVQRLCKEGKIKGARQFGSAWMIPATYRWKPQRPGPKPKVKK